MTKSWQELNRKNFMMNTEARAHIFPILVAVLVIVLIICCTLFLIYRAIKHPRLTLDNPPVQFRELEGKDFEEMKRRFEGAEPGSTLDEFFVADESAEQILIAHQPPNELALFNFGRSGDIPQTTDLSEMERFIKINRNTIEEELQKEYRRSASGGETLIIEAVQLDKDRYCGIHFCAKIPLEEKDVLQDRLLFLRDGTSYLVTVQSLSYDNNVIIVRYLLQQLCFK